MRRIVEKIMSLALPLCVCAGCDAYLDVDPSDKHTKEQVFGTELNTNSALNGIYMFITENSLYGANLTMTVMEAMAQRYDLSNQSHPYYVFGAYKTEETAYKDAFSTIWSSSYKAILNLNEFIAEVSKREGVLTQDKKDILLGEAYGLRAFLHFDLLRIFGPVYQDDSTSLAIPYSDLPGAELSPMLPAREVMDGIVRDLNKAEELLKNDPIITKGVSDATTGDPYTDFYNFRNQRLNYYAVKALQARVLLYRINKPAAYAAAKVLIDAPLYQAKKLFPWTTHSNISQGLDNMFYPEIIFGLYNSTLYSNYSAYFSDNLERDRILAPSKARLETSTGATAGMVPGVFNSLADYRYLYLWQTKGDYVYFNKYATPTNTRTPTKNKYMQPLIRKSELFYIMAECETVLEKKRGYLDSVRGKRGLPASTASASGIQSEIAREYIKELFGEGQLFFYYKRQGTPHLPNSSNSSALTYSTEGSKIAVYGGKGSTPNYYQVAIPLNEKAAR